MKRYYKRWFWPLVLPAIILFAFTTFVPFLVGIFYSFTGWKGTFFLKDKTPYENPFQAIVGFQNYIDAFKNAQFIHAFWYTVKFTLIAVVVINVVSLILALILTNIKRFTGLFRSAFFIPNLLGGLALGFVWQFIFEVIFSKIFFGPNGIIPIEALTNMTQGDVKPLFALVIMVTWQMAGYMMVIYITGINNIPSDLYEAAELDGASKFKQFWVITVPMLMPAFTIVFFLTLANCFKLLDQNIALTNGAYHTRLLALQILRTPSDILPPDYGQAQAQAVIFFIIVAIVTLIQVVITKKQEVEM